MSVQEKDPNTTQQISECFSIITDNINFSNLDPEKEITIWIHSYAQLLSCYCLQFTDFIRIACSLLENM